MTVSVAALRVLAEHGVQPALAAGHSLGEWSAHVAAGTLTFADAVRAVKARGRAMQQAVPAGQGAMAAILSLDPEQVAEACEEAANGDRADCRRSQSELAGADGDLRRDGGRREGRGAVQGQRRAAHRDASGQRSLPLRADAAGAGRSGACAGRLAACRSALSRRCQRERDMVTTAAGSARRSHRAGDRRGALGGLRAGRWSVRKRKSSSKSVPARCSAAC